MAAVNHHSRPSGLSTFLFGADYYPEQWNDEDRARDPELMRAAGFNCVRMGDYGWARIEPEAGRYDFSFFDAQIERLAAEKIYTILCTPTAGPPRWLTTANPEMLRLNAAGRPVDAGSRYRACFCSPFNRERARVLVAALAEHYRQNDAVIGWQVDDGYSNDIRECSCEDCRVQFRAYLRRTYGTVDGLNRAWGTAFWSGNYTSFDQVDAPRALGAEPPNPAHTLDYTRFLASEMAAFNHEQVQILRDARTDWWITHNFVPTPRDFLRMTADLDFAGFDFHPMFLPSGDRAAAGASRLDTIRSFGGNFLVTGLQSGPASGGDFLQDTPHPGQMRLSAYQTIAHGADGVLHFPFRTARAGAGQYWGGVVGHDNYAGGRYEEVCREGREFSLLGPLLLGSTPDPEVGILLDRYLSEMSHAPISLGLPSHAECAEAVHRAFFESPYSAGYVNPEDSFASFKLIVLAGVPILSNDLVRRITTFVEMGGTLLVTSRSGIKDGNGNLLAEPAPGPLAALCGIRVREFTRVNHPDLSPNVILLSAAAGGAAGRPGGEQPALRQNEWIECLEPTTAEILGTWEDMPYAGCAGLTLNRVGMGRVIYLGTLPSATNVRPLLFPLAGEANLLPTVAAKASGIEIAVRRNGTEKFLFVLNHTDETIVQRSLPEGQILVGDAQEWNSSHQLTLPAYGVAVIRVQPPQE